MKPENKLIPVKRWYHLAKGERGKVVPAFKDLHGHGDLVVLDAGRYGFVELQYFRAKSCVLSRHMLS